MHPIKMKSAYTLCAADKTQHRGNFWQREDPTEHTGWLPHGFCIGKAWFCIWWCGFRGVGHAGLKQKKTRRMRYTGSGPTVCRQEVCPSLPEALPHRGKCRASRENRDTFTVCRPGQGGSRGED